MKKIIYSLTAVIWAGMSFAQVGDWNHMDTESTFNADEQDLAMSTTGKPYIAKHNNNDAKVLEWNGNTNQWEQIGGPLTVNVANSGGDDIQIEIAQNGYPVVAVRELFGGDYFINMYKYDGFTWNTFGSPNTYQTTLPNRFSIAVDSTSNDTYLAYYDNDPNTSYFFENVVLLAVGNTSTSYEGESDKSNGFTELQDLTYVNSVDRFVAKVQSVSTLESNFFEENTIGVSMIDGGTSETFLMNSIIKQVHNTNLIFFVDHKNDSTAVFNSYEIGNGFGTSDSLIACNGIMNYVDMDVAPGSANYHYVGSNTNTGVGDAEVYSSDLNTHTKLGSDITNLSGNGLIYNPKIEVYGDYKIISYLNNNGEVEVQEYNNEPTAIASSTNKIKCFDQTKTFTNAILVDDQNFDNSNITFAVNSTTDPAISAASVTIGGSYPNYSMSIAPGSSVSSPTNVTVEVEMYEFGSLVDTIDVDVTVVPKPAPTFDQPSYVMCISSSPVVLMQYVSPNGGTFSGLGVQGNKFYSSIAGVGTHEVIYTYSNAAGCVSVDTAEIEVTAPPNVSLSINDAECDSTNGSVDATINSPHSPFQFYWSNGETTEDIDSLSAGIYFINVVDSRGCTTSKTANVSSNAFTANVVSVDDVVCHGQGGGAIDIEVNGSGTYNYEWLNNGATTQDVSGIQGGTWEVYIENQDSCSVTKVIEVEEPDPITWTASTISTSCGNNQGSAICNTSGGTPPYSFNWSNGTTGTGIDSIGNLPAGVYSVVITDDNGCTKTWNTTVTNSNGPQINIDTAINPGCTSTTGSIDINISSSSGIQNIQWSNGMTTEDISGLSAGFYSVEVTDNSGCTSTQGLELSNEAPPAIEICMVTVDTNTITNQVVWEKPVSSVIDHYNIYRETSTAGQYQLIASQSYSLETKFTDSVAYPHLRSWRYKISTVNSCGIESPLSPSHKTIHLTENLALGGGVNLIWDEYEGFSYNTYEVYRHTAINGWQEITMGGLPASGATSFTDPNVSVTTSQLDYFISVDAPNTCTSEKATDHNATRSNRSNYSAGPNGGDDNSLDINEVQQAEVTIYPNPTNGWINLEWSAAQKEVQYRIIDASGKLIRSWQSNKQYERVNLANLEAGLYFITLRNENTKHQYRVIKQ